MQIKNGITMTKKGWEEEEEFFEYVHTGNDTDIHLEFSVKRGDLNFYVAPLVGSD